METKCEFLTATVELEAESVNDEWKFPFNARVTEAALSNGQLPKLRWEELVFGDGPIPGASSVAKIPQDLLDRREAAREELAAGMPTGAPTFEEWVKSGNRRKVELRKLDRNIDLELDWLENHAPKILLQRIHDQVLEKLPSASVRTTLPEVLQS